MRVDTAKVVSWLSDVSFRADWETQTRNLRAAQRKLERLEQDQIQRIKDANIAWVQANGEPPNTGVVDYSDLKPFLEDGFNQNPHYLLYLIICTCATPKGWPPWSEKLQIDISVAPSLAALYYHRGTDEFPGGWSGNSPALAGSPWSNAPIYIPMKVLKQGRTTDRLLRVDFGLNTHRVLEVDPSEYPKDRFFSRLHACDLIMEKVLSYVAERDREI